MECSLAAVGFVTLFVGAYTTDNKKNTFITDGFFRDKKHMMDVSGFILPTKIKEFYPECAVNFDG